MGFTVLLNIFQVTTSNDIFAKPEEGNVFECLSDRRNNVVIAADLKEALSFYAESGGKGDPTLLQEQAVVLMMEKLEVVAQMFREYPESGYSDIYMKMAADPKVRYITSQDGFKYA